MCVCFIIIFGYYQFCLVIFLYFPFGLFSFYLMPRRSKENAFMQMVNNGYSVGQAVSNLMARRGNRRANINNAARGLYRSGAGAVELFKRRKGGVIKKQGGYQFINDGKPPYTRAQFNRLYGKRGGGATSRLSRRGYLEGIAGGRANLRKSRPPIRAGPRSFASMQMTPYQKRSPMQGQLQQVDNQSSILLKHFEPVSSIQGNAGGTNNPMIFFYKLNAGNRALFRWGSQIVYNYQYYRLQSMTFKLTSTCASTTTGRWAMGCDYNAMYDTSTVTTVDNIIQLDGVFGDVKDHIIFTLDSGMVNRNRKQYNISTNILPPNSDPKEFIMGNFYIGVESDSNVVMGNLVVSYSFVLSDPRPNLISLTSAIQGIPPATEALVGYPDLLLNFTEHAKNPCCQLIENEANGQQNAVFFPFQFAGIIRLTFEGTLTFSGLVYTEADSYFHVTNVDGTTMSLVTTLDFLGCANNASGGYSEWYAVLKVGCVLAFFFEFAEGDSLTSLDLFVTQCSINPQTSQVNPSISYNEKPITSGVRVHRFVERKIEDNEHKSEASDHITFLEYYEHEPKLIKKLKPGEGRNMRKGGDTDEHALCFITLLFLFIIGYSQIHPPYSFPPTTARPTTLRPTRNPTTRTPTTASPTYVFFRSSLITASGTASAPFTTVSDKVVNFKMFTKINNTHFSLNHFGMVAVYMYISGTTLDIPAFEVIGPPDSHAYDNFGGMQNCLNNLQATFQLINVTYASNVFQLAKTAGTSATTLYAFLAFTPVNGFKLFGGIDRSYCDTGCSSDPPTSMLLTY